MENTTPQVPTDVIAPSAADTQVTETAPVTAAPVSEDVQTPAADDTEQNVPFSRFQEVNNKAKAESERAAELQARVDEYEANKPSEPEVELDDDVKATLDSYLKQNGYVRQEDLNAKELALQADRDVAELKTRYTDFDKTKVLDFAKEKQINLSSKDALEATYLFMNKDSIFEAERKSAVAAAQAAPQAVAEKPGAGGAITAPSTDAPGDLKSRIASALSKAR
jgi:hypothetical protein